MERQATVVRPVRDTAVVPPSADQPQRPLGASSYGQNLLEDVLERFIRPELRRRIEGGQWNPDEPVFIFQVLFRDGEPPEVRLNGGIGGTLKATAARPLEAGEEVGPSDFRGVSSYEPRPEDRGVPHVTAFAHVGGWSVVFEFARGHPKRHEFLALAQEFLRTAEDALTSGLLGPFVDNAFSAAELFARAELLSCRPTVEIVLNTKDHGVVASTYKRWSDLGNTAKVYPGLLKRLHKLRARGRYLDARLALSFEQRAEILARLRDMSVHVARLVHGEDLPSSFNVYATREIRAGQLIGRDDYALSAPRRQTSARGG